MNNNEKIRTYEISYSYRGKLFVKTSVVYPDNDVDVLVGFDKFIKKLYPRHHPEMQEVLFSKHDDQHIKRV